MSSSFEGLLYHPNHQTPDKSRIILQKLQAIEEKTTVWLFLALDSSQGLYILYIYLLYVYVYIVYIIMLSYIDTPRKF